MIRRSSRWWIWKRVLHPICSSQSCMCSVFGGIRQGLHSVRNERRRNEESSRGTEAKCWDAGANVCTTSARIEKRRGACEWCECSFHPLHTVLLMLMLIPREQTPWGLNPPHTQDHMCVCVLDIQDFEGRRREAGEQRDCSQWSVQVTQRDNSLHPQTLSPHSLRPVPFPECPCMTFFYSNNDPSFPLGTTERELPPITKTFLQPVPVPALRPFDRENEYGMSPCSFRVVFTLSLSLLHSFSLLLLPFFPFSAWRNIRKNPQPDSRNHRSSKKGSFSFTKQLFFTL